MTTMFDAAAVIGAGRPDDYLLSPIEHAERLRASAPKLATLLTHSAPVELAQQYAEALAAERMFKRWLTRANWTVLATATVSAVLEMHARTGQRRGQPDRLYAGRGNRRWADYRWRYPDQHGRQCELNGAGFNAAVCTP